MLEALAEAAAGGAGAGTAIALVWWALTKCFGSYWSEKGKNLATKQDVAEITNQLEAAKLPFQELLEATKARHQLRFAAIDDRLRAHQQAFVKWVAILNAMHTRQRLAVVAQGMDWYRQHCLYLDPRVREAFSAACFSAQMHDSYLDRPTKEGASTNWAVIMDFPNVLFEAVQLTPITATEQEQLETLAKKAQ